MKYLMYIMLLVASIVRAQTPTPATFNPVPQSNGAFMSDLDTYLRDEDADRYASGAEPYQIAGCVHGTAGGLVGTFSVTCQALVAGHYVLEPATTIDYTGVAAATDVCWLAVSDDTTTAVGGWTRAVDTHYLIACNNDATTRPALGTTHATIVERVTITAGAITAVDSMYATRPYMRTFTNASEVTDSRVGQFWYRAPNVQLFYATGPNTLFSVVSGDVDGCAFCGATASGFFPSGQIETTRGGTGADSSGWTGIAEVTAGVWAPASTITPEQGGFGEDVSACKASGGLPHWTTASAFSCGFGAYRVDANEGDITVDGTHCQKSTPIALVSGIALGTWSCAANTASVFYFSTQMPSSYATGEPVTMRLTGTNTGSGSGDTGWDVTCQCVTTTGGGSTLTAANFAATTDLDMTWTGTVGQILSGSTAMVCGGTCTGTKLLIVRATMDTTATTHATPADIKWSNLFVQIPLSGL